MRRRFGHALALLTVAATVLSLLPVSVLAAPPAPEAAKVESASDAHLTKISPDLRSAALSPTDKKVHVRIFAAPGTDWKGLLERPLTRRFDVDGMRITSGWASESALLKLASLPGVEAITRIGGAITPLPPEGPVTRPRIDRSAPSQGTSLPSAPGLTTPRLRTWNAPDIVKSRQANANGFDGTGVIVSVNDTGVDFAHPDLQGTQARVTDPESPYYGWPLVADADSIIAFLESGGDTSNTYYADTSFTFTYPAGTPTGTVQIYNGVMTHTVVFPNTSKSGVYHYGWHPDYSLGYVEGEDEIEVSPMVLVVDETTAGVYDTVYVDLGDGFELTYDFTLARPARKGSEEVWADLTGDGVADISGGMIYWIADGAHWMPGTDVLFDMTGIPPIPAGDLVAFFGDYNGQSHGTGVASQIVAQGVITSQFGQLVNVPNLPGITEDGQVPGGVLHGTAPKAKIFAALQSEDNWIIAALGYDGLPGTSDDAQIITNSWGYLNILPGWDIFGRFATWLVRRVNPYVTLMAAAGNGGYGYGVMDPHGASSSILTVGASTQYGTDDFYSIISDTTQITYDDIIYYSNRGPNGLGQIKPHVVCIGNSATGAVPLNLSISPLTRFYDGQTAWEEFGGTSQATPMCAGVLATVQQAFKGRTGSWPTYLQAGRLMMNGADNLYYDILNQGAGRANADRSTKIAAGLAGAYVNPSMWQVGDYRGTTYEAFTHIMLPGTSKARTFEVTNWNLTNTITYTIATQHLVKVSEVITTFTSLTVTQEYTYTFKRPDYLWRIDSLIPADTDLMEINVYSPYGQFSFGDPSNPASQTARGNNAWYVRVYDWTDWDEDGVLWTDLNGNGVVDPGELDEPGTDPLSGAPNRNTSAELNVLTEGNNSANTLQMRVQKPLSRMKDGLWLGLVHRVRNIAQPRTDLQIVYRFYKHVDWPWLTTDVTTLTVPPSSTASFTATMTLPADTPLGIYEGSIVLSDVSGETPIDTVLPVMVNVATDQTTFTITPTSTNEIFDNSHVYGGYDWRGNGWYPQGDWRLFFTDVPDTAPIGPNTSFLIEASWVYTPTDIDIWAYGPGAHFSSIPVPTSVIGPYNLVPTGNSPQTNHTTGTGTAYAFNTSSGGSKEMITAKAQKGLNEFLFHNVLYNGPATGEPFTVTVGTAGVSPTSIVITTEAEYVAVPLSFVASLDLPNGLQGIGFGLSRPMVFDNQFVAQGANRYYTFTVNNAGLLALRTEPTGPNYDIDLYLEREVGSSWVRVGVSGGADAYEQIVLQLPPDGRYRARVNGYAVPSVNHKYRLTIDLIEGRDIVLTGLPTTAISAGTTVNFTAHLQRLAWTGKRFGIVYIGPAGSPTAFMVPVTVVKPIMKLYLPTILLNVPPQ